MDKGLNPFHRRERDSHFLGVFNAVSDGLILSNLETGLLVEANPAVYVMHGYTREEFIGLELRKIIHPDDQNIFIKHTRISQSDEMLDIQTLNVCQNGNSFHAEWRGTVTIYQECACLLGIVRDVSKRMTKEQLLHKQEKIRAHEQATLLEISHTLASTLRVQAGVNP